MSRAFANRPLLRSALGIVTWIPVGIFVVRHVYAFANVGGESMQPTFNPELQLHPLHRDIVLLEKWRRTFSRGDVVSLWSPNNPEQLTTKRIVALQGDVVHPLPPSPPGPVRIPPGHVWVEGDSRFRSRDSNTYGPIPLSLIDARVSHIVWPLKRFTAVQPGPGKSAGRVKRLGPDSVNTAPVSWGG